MKKFSIKPFKELFVPRFFDNPVAFSDIYTRGSAYIILINIFTILIFFLYTDTSDVLAILIRLTGIIAIVLLSINFILATRWNILEVFFDSIEKVYKIHDVVGRTILGLSVLHLFIQIYRVLPNSEFIIRLLIPGSSLGLTLGILGFWSMVLLIILTIFIKFPYNWWFQTHRLMIIPFILISLHTFVADGDVNNNTVLKAWVIFWVIWGLIAYFWKIFIYEFLGIKGEITEIRVLDDITEITIKTNKRLYYKPAQFIFISILDNKEIKSKEKHPFSISGFNNEGRIRISAKNLGDYTSQLHKLNIGDSVKVYGPYGSFSNSYLKNKLQDQIWIGGGIGIAPFLSMLQHLELHPGYQKDRNINMFYCVNIEGEDVYKEEIQRIVRKLENVDLEVCYTTSRGYFFSLKEIYEKVGDESKVLNSKILMCGPTPMTSSLSKQFVKDKLSFRNIDAEEFDFL